jgi:hypothetical protein
MSWSPATWAEALAVVALSNGRPPACAATRADQIDPMTATP